MPARNSNRRVYSVKSVSPGSKAGMRCQGKLFDCPDVKDWDPVVSPDPSDILHCHKNSGSTPFRGMKLCPKRPLQRSSPKRKYQARMIPQSTELQPPDRLTLSDKEIKEPPRGARGSATNVETSPTMVGIHFQLMLQPMMMFTTMNLK